MRKVIRVVGAVIYDQQSDSFFVGQRGRKKKLTLKWEFIGGKVEDGEDLISALKREFKEEVDLNINPGKIVGKILFNYGGEIGKVEINFLECSKFKGFPRPDTEVYEICKWIPRLKLPNLDWVEADKKFAVRLAKVTDPSRAGLLILSGPQS